MSKTHRQRQRQCSRRKYSCIYRVTKKKGIIRILSSNLFNKSDFTFPRVFWNHNFEPVSYSYLNFTHSESSTLKNACAEAQIYPQPFEVLLKHCRRLCTGNPTQICVCWHNSTFPQLKLSREFSSLFFEFLCVIYVTERPSLISEIPT